MKDQKIVSFRQRLVRRHLVKGGIIAYPTESCFGLGCMPDNPVALKNLIHLKKRAASKGFILIGCNIKQLEKYIKPLSNEQINYLNHIWPAAKTFLIPCKKNTSYLLRGKQRDNLAVRIPAHPLAIDLCRQVRSPLVSTSANMVNKKNCKSIRAVRKQFGKKVLIVKGVTGKNKKPSQIIDLRTHTRIR